MIEKKLYNAYGQDQPQQQQNWQSELNHGMAQGAPQQQNWQNEFTAQKKPNQNTYANVQKANLPAQEAYATSAVPKGTEKKITMNYDSSPGKPGYGPSPLLNQISAPVPGRTPGLWKPENGQFAPPSQPPSGYSSQYQPALDGLLNTMLDRKEFSYDMNNDPLYQQYKDQYVKQGQQAMRDTMGQAASLTGGYGNSYAATAGNQAYQGYLGKLNEVAPDLYAQALNQYTAESSRLNDNLAALQSAENSQYGRYRDQVSDYFTNQQFDFDREQFDYGKTQDAQQQSNWQTEFDYGKTQDAQQQSNWRHEISAQYPRYKWGK